MMLKKILDSLAMAPFAQFSLVQPTGRIDSITFEKIHKDVTATVKHLNILGVRPRDCVGIHGDNCYGWVVMDLALIAMDCVSVAIPTDVVPPEALEEAISTYGLALLVEVGSRGRLSPETSKGVMFVSEKLEFSDVHRCHVNEKKLPSDVFSIVFSSGTSGKKKGLLLTRQGVETTIRTSSKGWSITAQDNICVVLPFSNFQQRYLLYTAVFHGCNVCMVAPERMFQKLRTLRPTILVGPPSFYEMVENRVSTENLIGRWRFMLASVLHLLLPNVASGWLFRRLCRKWNYFYGDKIRLMYVGSAPVKKSTLSTLQTLGLPLFQAYGLTEFGWIAFNTPQTNKLGAVGKLADGVEAKIGVDQELWVRNLAAQSAGYIYDGIDEQDKVFMPDGYIATGDLCRIDRKGYVFIVGRKKNLIVTRSGVKINPEELEIEIGALSGVIKAMVFAADDMGNLGCIVWVESLVIENQKALESEIENLSVRQMSHYRKIRSIRFASAEDLQSSKGLLTRNLKLNRTAVLAYYKTLPEPA